MKCVFTAITEGPDSAFLALQSISLRLKKAGFCDSFVATLSLTVSLLAKQLGPNEADALLSEYIAAYASIETRG